MKLIVQEPINAKISFDAGHTVEIYEDAYNSTLTRILEPGKTVDFNNLDEV